MVQTRSQSKKGKETLPDFVGAVDEDVVMQDASTGKEIVEAVPKSLKDTLPEHVRNNPRYQDFITQEDPAVAIEEKFKEQKRRKEVQSDYTLDKVKRRKAKFKQSLAKAQDSATSVGGFTPFDVPNQNYFLINIAHRNQRPKSKKPAVRILGAFPEPVAAAAHAVKLVKQHDHECDLRRVQARRPFLIASRQYDSPDKELEAIRNRQSENLKYRNVTDEEFESNVVNKQMGTHGKSKEYRRLKARKRTNVVREEAIIASEQSKAIIASQSANNVSEQSKAINASAQSSRVLADDSYSGLGRNKRAKNRRRRGKQGKGGATLLIDEPDLDNVIAPIPDAARKSKQKFFVVAFLLDYSDAALSHSTDPEPAAVIYGGFESESAAWDYIENTASLYEPDVHLDVVDGYEWLFPEDVDPEQMKEVYRDTELNKIMNQRKKEKQKLADFESYCRELKMDTPVTEVIGDGTEDGKVTVTSTVPKAAEIATADGTQTSATSQITSDMSMDQIKQMWAELDAQKDQQPKALVPKNVADHDPSLRGFMGQSAVSARSDIGAQLQVADSAQQRLENARRQRA